MSDPHIRLVHLWPLRVFCHTFDSFALPHSACPPPNGLRSKSGKARMRGSQKAHLSQTKAQNPPRPGVIGFILVGGSGSLVALGQYPRAMPFQDPFRRLTFPVGSFHRAHRLKGWRLRLVRSWNSCLQPETVRHPAFSEGHQTCYSDFQYSCLTAKGSMECYGLHGLLTIAIFWEGSALPPRNV